MNGIVYSAGDRVSSDLEVRNYELAFGYKIRLGRRLMIAPVFQINVLDGLLETVDLDLLGSAVEEEFVVPIALMGLRVEVYPLARLALFAEAKGFKASSWGELDEARVADGEIGLSFNLSRNVVLTGSYHLSDFRFDVSDTEVDLELSGLRVSLDLRF